MNGDIFGQVFQNQLKAYGIDGIAKAITVEAFRNGPVEDMHAEGKLSDEDIKTLNKYMVNKIARILTMYEAKDWFGLAILMQFAGMYTTGWDKPEIDMEEIDKLKENFTNDLMEKINQMQKK